MQTFAKSAGKSCFVMKVDGIHQVTLPRKKHSGEDDIKRRPKSVTQWQTGWWFDISHTKKACGVCFFVLEEMLRIFFAIFLGVMMSNGHLYLAGGLKHFLCSPLPGKMIQFDKHIFQMGWFNHQLVIVVFDAVFSLLSLLGPTAFTRPPQPHGDLGTKGIRAERTSSFPDGI